jgi:hypothetical protein
MWCRTHSCAPTVSWRDLNRDRTGTLYRIDSIARSTTCADGRNGENAKAPEVSTGAGVAADGGRPGLCGSIDKSVQLALKSSANRSGRTEANYHGCSIESVRRSDCGRVRRSTRSSGRSEMRVALGPFVKERAVGF